MRLSTLINEENDLVHTVLSRRANSTNLAVLDVHGLATAWLHDRVKDWQALHEGAYTDADLPDVRLNRSSGESIGPTDVSPRLDHPFTSGALYRSDTSSTNIVVPHPTFFSPAMRRDGQEDLLDPRTGSSSYGSTANMPGFGPLGENRFCLFHEVGHHLQNELGMHAADPTDLRHHHAELRSDAFAVAWAVACGASAQAVVRDVGVYRACSMASHISTGYFTFPGLAPAAEIGQRFSQNHARCPWAMMEAIDTHVRPHALSLTLIERFAGCPTSEASEKEASEQILNPIRGFLQQQRPWTDADERAWWARLCASNPKESPMLRRMPGMITLAQYTRDRRWNQSGAIDARVVLPLLSGVRHHDPKAWERIQATIPTDTTPGRHAEALGVAAKALTCPIDTKARSFLLDLQAQLEAAPQPLEAVHAKRTPVIELRAQQPLLVDARLGLPDPAIQRSLIVAMRRDPPSSLMVLAPQPLQALRLARDLRQRADCLRIPIIHQETDVSPYASSINRIVVNPKRHQEPRGMSYPVHY